MGRLKRIPTHQRLVPSVPASRRASSRAARFALLGAILLIPLIGTCDNGVNLKDEVEVAVMKANDRYLEVIEIDMDLKENQFSPTGTIGVYFDRPVDISTVNPDTVVIRDAGGDGKAIDYPEYGITYVESARLVRIRVYPYLPIATDVSVTVIGVRGMDGSVIHDTVARTVRTQNVLAGSILGLAGADPSSLEGYSVTGSVSVDVQVNDKFNYFTYMASLDPTSTAANAWFDPTDLNIDRVNRTTLTNGNYRIENLDLTGLAGYGEGPLTLTIQFRGSDSSSGSLEDGLTDEAEITIDTSVPDGGAIVVDGGAAWATEPGVTATFTAQPSDPVAGDFSSGIRDVSYSNDGVSWSDFASIESSVPWNLVTGAGGGDARGQRTVYARVRDNAGNISAAVADGIGFDDIAPAVVAPAIDGGNAYTATGSVSLSWATPPTDADSGVDAVELSNDGATWVAVPYPEGDTAWDLLSGAGGDDGQGTKTLRVRASDAAGNRSGVVTATIGYDSVQPSAGTWIVNGGSGYVNVPGVTLTATTGASDATSGVEAIRFSNDGLSWSDWETPGTSKAWNIAADPGGNDAQGTKTVRIAARDRAGNESAPAIATVAYDTVPPAAPSAPILDAADDTGSSSGDGVTKQTEGLSLSGTAEANSAVTILRDGAEIAALTAGADGSWGGDVDLSAGTWNVTVRATDRAGNQGPESPALQILIDTFAPAVGAPDLDAADDSGSSSADDVTKVTSALTFSGTAEAGATVRLMSGATALATVQADGAGTWSADLDLTEGTWTVYARGSDLAGNEAESGTLSITVDTTGPNPTAPDLSSADDTGSSSADNVTKFTSALTLSGTAEAGSAVSLMSGATTLGDAQADATGAWSLDVSLTEGVWALFARAVDIAGNEASSASLSLTVDATAPSVGELDLAESDDTGSSPTDNLTNRTSALTLSGTAESGASVSIMSGAATLGTAQSVSGTWTADVSLEEGAWNVFARATDAAGNQGDSAALTITVDATAPESGMPDLASADDTGSSATDNLTKNLAGLTLSGTAEANATVAIMAGDAVLATIGADSGGGWTADIDLVEGSWELFARAFDAAGNLGDSAPLTLTIDATAPTSTAPDLSAADDTGTSSSDNVTANAAGLTFSGTAEAGVAVSLVSGSTVLSSGTASGGGAWSMDLALSEGTWNVFARVTDAAGNESSTAATGITVDLTKPAVGAPDLATADDSGTSGVDNLTGYTSGLTFSGTAEANADVMMMSGSTIVSKVQATETGTWAMDLALSEGVWSLFARAADLAGNETSSGTLTVTIDATAPAVSSPTLDPSDDTGLKNDDGITYNTTGLTFSGTAEKGATVRLYDGKTLLGTPDNGTGAWTLDLSLAEGSYSVSAYAFDAAGNGKSSAAIPIVIDATKPGAPVITLATAATDRTPTLSWVSGGEGGGGTYYRWSTSSSWSTGTMPGSFTQPTDLADGTYTFYVWEYDLAWNWNQTTLSVTIAAPPNRPIVTAAASVTLDTTPTWTWTSGGFGNGTYRYQLDSVRGIWSASSTATAYTPSSALTDATHTLYVEELDAEGNWSSYGSATTLVTPLIPYNEQKGVSTTPTLAWRAVKGATYKVLVSGDGTKFTTLTTTTGTSYRVATTLKSGLTYYWKVEATTLSGTTLIPSDGSAFAFITN